MLHCFIQANQKYDSKSSNQVNRTPFKFQNESSTSPESLSMPMGVDYVVIGFDMEVQPLVTHNAA